MGGENAQLPPTERVTSQKLVTYDTDLFSIIYNNTVNGSATANPKHQTHFTSYGVDPDISDIAGILFWTSDNTTISGRCCPAVGGPYPTSDYRDGYWNIVSLGDVKDSAGNALYLQLTTSHQLQICFKEDTKILCLMNNQETYVPIQYIRKGMLVKTYKDGYVKVDMIGNSKIYNPDNDLCTKNRLYRCSQDNYPELTEDLIITGCHSILVPELTEEQKEKTIELMEKVYVTDHHYRLVACLDERAKPYEIDGLHNIWHLALEHENDFYNYGIYANGLLVETTSKRMLLKYSGMKIVN
jgi:hypothetical protein